MKYERTESFKRDYRRLSEAERRAFRAVVQDHFGSALDHHRDEPGGPWPARLRVKGVRGAPGVWEMTWSFTDPDGRATWEWVSIEGETGIRWRRIGSHAIFAEP